jgi:hypothetical protein
MAPSTAGFSQFSPLSHLTVSIVALSYSDDHGWARER